MKQTSLLVLAVLAVVAAGSAFLYLSRQRARQRCLRSVLDAADALELRVRNARRDLEGVTRSGDASDALQEVMRDVLKQRLWLKEHGMNASLAALEDVRCGLDAASRRLDQFSGAA